jgi:hypothetical protein
VNIVKRNNDLAELVKDPESGIWPSNGPFWQIPRMLLSGSAAAGGIALISSIGSLSGWVGPSVVGCLEDVTGKTIEGLYVVSGLEIFGSDRALCSAPDRHKGDQARVKASRLLTWETI